MKLGFWDCFFLIITWWVCSTCSDFIGLQWQIDYDAALRATYNMGGVDTE